MTQAVLAHIREGHGPSLLLIHGGVGSHNHWVRNVPELARYFTVVAVDLPGYGASHDVPEDIQPEAYLDMVADAARLLCGIHFYVCGFSFGGVVAAAIAARLPTNVARLSLIAPGGFGVPKGRQLDVRPLPRERAESEEVRAALRHNLTVTMLADPAVADDATVELHRNNIERTRFDSRRLSLQERLPADLRRIACPLQVIWGERDLLAYPSIADRVERVMAVVPTARVDIIANGGHWIQYECPTETNRVLLEFMRFAPETNPSPQIQPKEKCT